MRGCCTAREPTYILQDNLPDDAGCCFWRRLCVGAAWEFEFGILPDVLGIPTSSLQSPRFKRRDLTQLVDHGIHDHIPCQYRVAASSSSSRDYKIILLIISQPCSHRSSGSPRLVVDGPLRQPNAQKTFWVLQFPTHQGIGQGNPPVETQFGS